MNVMAYPRYAFNSCKIIELIDIACVNHYKGEALIPAFATNSLNYTVIVGKLWVWSVMAHESCQVKKMVLVQGLQPRVQI